MERVFVLTEEEEEIAIKESIKCFKTPNGVILYKILANYLAMTSSSELAKKLSCLTNEDFLDEDQIQIYGKKIIEHMINVCHN